MPPKITEILNKHNRALDAALLPAIVVLVGLSAFGLGRLSVAGEVETPEPIIGTSEAATGEYVASKSGNKYYLPHCTGASNIREENKVHFATVAQAEAAGYTAAANCPGL